MKRKILASFLIFSLVIVSCSKKKENTNPRDRIVGFWSGKYGTGSQTPDKNYSFLFRKDGTVRIYADSADTASSGKAEGTFVVLNSTVKTPYNYILSGNSFSTSAEVDAGFTTMDGTYGSNANVSGGGTFRF